MTIRTARSSTSPDPTAGSAARRLAERFEGDMGFDRKECGWPLLDCVYVRVGVTSDGSWREGLRTLQECHRPEVASVIQRIWNFNETLEGQT